MHQDVNSKWVPRIPRGRQAESAMMTPGPRVELDLVIDRAAAVRSRGSAVELAIYLPAAVLVGHRHHRVETCNRDKARNESTIPARGVVEAQNLL